MNKQLFHKKLYHWYEINHRILPWRETNDAYRIWISEIILQQTRVAQGLEYYLRFIDRFPTVESLAEASEDEVLLYWQGLGYYSRARNLHAAARQIANGGNIFPRTWDEIRSLKGVGDYTAGAIASFAYNQPYPAMDGNVYRVLSRLYDADVIFDTGAGKKYFHKLAEQLLDQENARLFNSAIMEFGALHCLPQSPDCQGCPLSEFCQAFAHGTVELLPLRKKKNALRERYLNYKIYINERHETLIHQRVEKDIWQHLYEFVLEENNSLTEDKNEVTHMDFTHTLSHQRIHARFHIYRVHDLPDIANTKTVRWEELEEYAFSRLTLMAIHGVTQ